MNPSEGISLQRSIVRANISFSLYYGSKKTRIYAFDKLVGIFSGIRSAASASNASASAVSASASRRSASALDLIDLARSRSRTAFGTLSGSLGFLHPVMVNS
jgi:hypothetical protein